MTLSGLANSLAFGFTVGFSPISSSLFKKYGYKKISFARIWWWKCDTDGMWFF